MDLFSSCYAPKTVSFIAVDKNSFSSNNHSFIYIRYNTTSPKHRINEIVASVVMIMFYRI